MGQSLNIIPDFQYSKLVLLYLTTVQLVHDYSELTLFFIQLHIRMVIIHFLSLPFSYTGLAKGNEIDKILIEFIL